MGDAWFWTLLHVLPCLKTSPARKSWKNHRMDARAGNVAIHVSFATLTEVDYIITQERSREDAAAALVKMKNWPVQWLHTDEELCGDAAKLKVENKISFADAFSRHALRFDATWSIKIRISGCTSRRTGAVTVAAKVKCDKIEKPATIIPWIPMRMLNGWRLLTVVPVKLRRWQRDCRPVEKLCGTFATS